MRVAHAGEWWLATRQPGRVWGSRAVRGGLGRCGRSVEMEGNWELSVTNKQQQQEGKMPGLESCEHGTTGILLWNIII